MRVTVTLLAIFLSPLLAGCDGSQEVSDDDAIMPSDYLEVVDDTAEVDDWKEFSEVAGEETYAEARLQPSEPTAGEPAKVEYLAGSYHGIPQGVRVWTRIGDPAAAKVYDDPNAGPEWVEMKPVTGRVYNPLKQDTKDVPLDYKTKGAEQGEILFVAELTFPAGESLVEFKTLAASEGAMEVGFEGWTVTAREAKPE